MKLAAFGRHVRCLAHWLGYVAATTCGLATLAVGGLWVRSYGQGESLCRWGPVCSKDGDAISRTRHQFSSHDGRLLFERRAQFAGWLKFPLASNDGWHYYPDGQHEGVTVLPEPQWLLQVGAPGFGYSGDVTWIVVGCPHWAVLLPLLLVDAWLVRRGVVRWRRRRRAGCCEKCGYNLTGNVSGVCPECGTPTPTGACD